MTHAESFELTITISNLIPLTLFSNFYEFAECFAMKWYENIQRIQSKHFMNDRSLNIHMKLILLYDVVHQYLLLGSCGFLNSCSAVAFFRITKPPTSSVEASSRWISLGISSLVFRINSSKILFSHERLTIHNWRLIILQSIMMYKWIYSIKQIQHKQKRNASRTSTFEIISVGNLIQKSAPSKWFYYIESRFESIRTNLKGKQKDSD